MKHIRYHIPAVSSFVACMQSSCSPTSNTLRNVGVRIASYPSSICLSIACLFLTYAVRPLIYEHLHSPTFLRILLLICHLYTPSFDNYFKASLFTSLLVADVCISYAGATCHHRCVLLSFVTFYCSQVHPRKSSIAFSSCSTSTVTTVR
jgi:hypothetical protein